MAAGTSDAWGLSAAATWEFCDRWTPFVRAGYGEGGAARAEASAALGCGYTLRNHDLVGFVASGARPSDGALRDQYTLQLFYNLALGEHVHLTPDLQVVFDPSRNPSEDVIAFLGLRLRLDF